MNRLNLRNVIQLGLVGWLFISVIYFQSFNLIGFLRSLMTSVF